MASTITVAQISDSHLKREPGAGDSSPDAMLRRAVALVGEVKPDLVVLTGDIADDGSTEAYERTAELVKVLDTRVMATAGNHDLPAGVATVLGADDEVTIGSWRVVLADTTIPNTEWGRIDVSALMKRLGPDRGTPTLLALHHPPISTSTHKWMRLEGGNELVAALSERSDVRVVISGHLHEAFNVVIGGVSYIGCSSSLYSIKHRGDQFILDNGHVGALMLSLKPDGDFTWKRLPDPNEASVVLGPFE